METIPKRARSAPDSPADETADVVVETESAIAQVTISSLIESEADRWGTEHERWDSSESGVAPALSQFIRDKAMQIGELLMKAVEDVVQHKQELIEHLLRVEAGTAGMSESEAALVHQHVEALQSQMGELKSEALQTGYGVLLASRPLFQLPSLPPVPGSALSHSDTGRNHPMLCCR